MHRTYVRNKQSFYASNHFGSSLNLIRDKKVTVSVASTQYQIPRQTFYTPLNNSRGDGKSDGITTLSNEEVKFLIHVIIT